MGALDTRALVVVVVAATMAPLWLWILAGPGYSSGCKWMCNQRGSRAAGRPDQRQSQLLPRTAPRVGAVLASRTKHEEYSLCNVRREPRGRVVVYMRMCNV